MCLLTYFPESVQPDLKALRVGAVYNSDGHGFAIVIPKGAGKGSPRILVRKAMDAETLIKEFGYLRALYPDGPALFHSRITTDGVTDLFNCHPFMHSGDKRTVIGHNGILPASVRPEGKDPRSDTRIFAQEVAGVFRLHTVVGRRVAGEWMGAGNKIVILTVDPAYEKHGYIVNEKQGVWDGGIWYSNSSYKGYRSTVIGNHYYGSSWGDWEWCTAEACDAKVATVSPHTLICSRCKACSVCVQAPCECDLNAETGGWGKETLRPKGSSAVVGSPGRGVTVGAASIDDYRDRLDRFIEDMSDAGIDVGLPEEDGEGGDASHEGRFQLQEAIDLVDHLNNGGEIDDWAPDSAARQTLDEWLDSGLVVLSDGTLSRPSTDLVKVGDPADDQDYLIFQGTKYPIE